MTKQRTGTKRHIGLSLGADICWPICFEDVLEKLALSIPDGKQRITVDVERMSIEPFELSQTTKYDVVIDRLTHWYHVSREWIKKAVILDDVYVFNNPWSVQSMEKQTSYCAMMRLGMPIPRTWLTPPKSYEESPDLEATLQQYAKLFDLSDIGGGLGYPLFMKPYDGGGWRGVNKIDNEKQLQETYDESGKLVMHLQEGILPYKHFVRAVGLGPQVRLVAYDPGAPLHERYREDQDFLSQEDQRHLEDTVLVINSFFGWDFNSCESLYKDGVWHPIDFANPCPDSQVTSLHYHFPWLIGANLRWSIFCAVTRRKMSLNLNWDEYFAIADEPGTFAEKLPRYAAIARRRFAADEFEAFCAKHLSHLDEILLDYFTSDEAHSAVRKKVEALYPEDEHDEFTDKFWQAIQRWREHESAAAKTGA